MAKLVILTKNPESIKDALFVDLKSFIRNTFLHCGGPQVVVDSLIVGLKENGVGFEQNPRILGDGDIVYIPNNVSALRWAINKKSDGCKIRVIAGPNICTLPFEQDKILLDNNIDAVIVPSQWNRDLYLHFASQLREKLFVWAAGITIPNIAKDSQRDRVLLYRKNCPDKLYKDILFYLNENNIKFFEINYGHYRKVEFYEMLSRSSGAIFLQESESQGLALCEAWMHDVPTFVWNRGYWEYKEYKWFDSKISAPYLSDASGRFFNDFNDFKNIFPVFLKEKHFHPRDYAMANFSCKRSALELLRIIEKIKI